MMKSRQSGTIILRQIRKKKMNEVRGHYAKFGDAVVQRMLHFALKSNGVRQVLHRLSLGIAGPSETQAHSRIVSFIQEKGADKFIVALRSGEEFVPSVSFAPAVDPGTLASASDAVIEQPKPPRPKLNGAHLREHPRVRTNLTVLAVIRPSEGSTSCFESSGQICDVSALGLCLVVPNLPNRWYSALCKARGFVQITLRLPGENQDSQIKGTIAWMDFHKNEPEPYCRMGVDLGRSDEESKNAIQKMLRSIA